jgi:hypothetical protein
MLQADGLGSPVMFSWIPNNAGAASSGGYACITSDPILLQESGKQNAYLFVRLWRH